MNGGTPSMRQGELLLLLSEELSDLGASASSIQATLGEVLEATGSQTGVWHMQEIDRLQQMLDDLSAILRTAAEDDGPRVDVERLVRVARLGALRERLLGSYADGVPVQDAGFVAIF